MGLATSLLDSALAIVGRTGSGKSYAAKGMVERLIDAGRRVCIIDPTGAWWGLRRSADGAGEGFPIIIFGGDHADVPITETSGRALGDMIARGDVSQAIVDVSDMSTAAQIRFLTDLFEHLYTGNRAALHLVLDEADVMAPQNPLPETRRLQGVVNKIVRRGRIKGFRPLMITQRPQVIDKSVLSQVSTLVAMKLTAPQDRRAILDWVKACGGAAEMVDQLPGLPRGTGMVWDSTEGTMERVEFPPIRTFDSGRAPEHGEEEIEPQPLASIDVEALKRALDVKEEPKDGRNATADEIAAAERRGYERGVSAAAAHISGARLLWSPRPGQPETELQSADMHPAGQVFANMVLELLGEGAKREVFPAPTARQREAVAAPTAPRREASTPAGLNSAAQKMLAVLDTNPPVRRSWTQVATLAGLKARGGHFNAGRKGLLESGLILVDGDLVRIATPSASASDGRMNPAALLDMWAGNLSGAAPRVLRFLAAQKRPVSREAVAEALGMQPRGGHWNAAWKELRDNHLVIETPGGWRISDLFMEGA
ncbi:MAG: ATP-binding protein [Beijerinckiaceae bacterium]